MKTVQASEAKTHLLRLLDEVEKGETVLITRHGKPVARLVAEATDRKAKTKEAIEGFRALRAELAKTMEPLTIEEILAMRHEGHKY